LLKGKVRERRILEHWDDLLPRAVLVSFGAGLVPRDVSGPHPAARRKPSAHPDGRQPRPARLARGFAHPDRRA
jgi:hypothetical protein